MPPPSLDDDFLDRVRRSYRLGIVLGDAPAARARPANPFSVSINGSN
jgi:hypothetical protein